MEGFAQACRVLGWEVKIMVKCNQPGYKGTCIVVHSGSKGCGGYKVAFVAVEHIHGSTFRRPGKLFGIGWAVPENPVTNTLV